jgi:hypothetical protein
MIRSSTLAVTDTATAVGGDDNDSYSGRSIAVYHEAGDTVYLGADDVDDEGWPLVPGDKVSFTVQSDETLYAVCASGDTATLRVIEQGV